MDLKKGIQFIEKGHNESSFPARRWFKMRSTLKRIVKWVVEDTNEKSWGWVKSAVEDFIRLIHSGQLGRDASLKINLTTNNDYDRYLFTVTIDYDSVEGWTLFYFFQPMGSFQIEMDFRNFIIRKRYDSSDFCLNLRMEEYLTTGTFENGEGTHWKQV